MILGSRLSIHQKTCCVSISLTRMKNIWICWFSLAFFVPGWERLRDFKTCCSACWKELFGTEMKIQFAILYNRTFATMKLCCKKFSIVRSLFALTAFSNLLLLVFTLHSGTALNQYYHAIDILRTPRCKHN